MEDKNIDKNLNIEDMGEDNNHERDRKVAVNIVGEMRKSFLDYSMSVIVARALPDVRDGLKPVHRRILYTLYEEGMTPDKKYQKSANAVGAVMGHYHPHGDSAIYESMVRMAQDFTYRHTLVDGHGNFGSIDGDGAAASRYTEARLAKISMELLRDLNKDTVDFSENYDGQRKEPVVLPSRFPNILVNGNMLLILIIQKLLLLNLCNILRDLIFLLLVLFLVIVVLKGRTRAVEELLLLEVWLL